MLELKQYARDDKKREKRHKLRTKEQEDDLDSLILEYYI